MNTIKFGTDGWRAIIADTFTVANVARVAAATAWWLKRYNPNPKVVVGYDCRFAGPLFAETTAKVLCGLGVKVYFSDGFCSTPMVSLATNRLGCDAGVIITASHNPPDYNGYKLKASFGGPATPASIAEVERLIPEAAAIPNTTIKELVEQGMLEYHNFEDMYYQHVMDSFDMETIKKSGTRLAYDAMYGAGQRILPRILPDAVLLHCDFNPSFKGQAPEPIHKNLLEFSEMIKKSGNIDLGLATDGDADRIGLYDPQGNFVDSHHIILLLIHYLHKYKGISGQVVNAFSVSGKAKKLCEIYGLPYQVTGIGFKYICEIMIQPDANVMVGAEESGGIAVAGHVPERDGIWMGLLILEMIAKTGKSLNEMIQEVYDLVGAFSYDRDDLHITNEIKNRVLANCNADAYKAFGKFVPTHRETIDGFKYHFPNGEWMMIRASGTEPVLRIYGEAANPAAVRELLDEVRNAILT